MLECVANVAEGRDRARLARLADACGAALLDLHTDPDHHRSVFTLAGARPDDAVRAVERLAEAASALLDLDGHDGVHPRLGALDVVPFAVLDEPTSLAVDAAHRFASWLGSTLAVPSFFYDDADPDHRTLPELRRTAFTLRAPDVGPAAPHPRLGATAVGARAPLVAVNCWLDRDDPALAATVAAAVREQSGGLPGVRARGWSLPSVGAAQVSMNVADLAATGVEAACEEVRRRVEAAGGAVTRVEWVGLVPDAEVRRCSAEFRAWSGLGDALSLEGRLRAARRP